MRHKLRALRAALPSDARARADAGIAQALDERLAAYLLGTSGHGPVVVSAFWPVGDEPDLRPWLDRWARDARVRLALPVVHAQAAPLRFRAWTPAARMAPGAYRIPEPQETEELVPDVVLVPALGFTDAGDRIGYGGGYYDRTLEALRAAGRSVAAWGVAYAVGRLAPGIYAPAAHDQRLDAVITA